MQTNQSTSQESDSPVNTPLEDSVESLEQAVEDLMAQMWMVRTFVKHSEVVEDFPELMNLARVFFDTTRAVETRSGNVHDMIKMMQKKLSKVKAAANQFAIDAPLASDHMNFKQAVIAGHACARQMELLCQTGKST